MKPARRDTDNGILTALPVVVTSSFEGWLEEGQKLGRVARCFQWVIASWVLDGEHRWGDRATQAACEATGLAPQTVLNILSVARAFPPGRQRENLSFGHHAALTALTPAEQDRLLDKAEKEALSVTALRREAAGARGVRPAVALPAPAEPPAPDPLVPGCLVSIHGIGRCTITAIMAAEDGILPAPGTDVLIYCNRMPNEETS